MTKIIVLGGCGVVGSIAVRTLTSFPDFSEITIGDLNINKANKLAKNIASSKISVKEVNASNPKDLRKIINEFDLVLNCIGPFYKYGPPILKAAIDTRKNYIDINDDVDATIKGLAMHDEAKNAKLTALIGMGSSPGVTNLLAKFAHDFLLDELDSIDIYHAHGGEPIEGPGVIYHRIHSMSIDIPVFLEGEFREAKFFEDSGKQLEEEIEFLNLGKYRVHPYPHPETITLPKFIPKIKRVTNKGTVLPPEYFYLISDLVRLGFNSTEPIIINETNIKPIDFAISYILNQRDIILKQTNFGQQRGCVKILAKGIKEGKPHQYIFSLTSEGRAMGEGTGMPAAFGAVLMTRGLIQNKGVLPPEAGINPSDFLEIMKEYLNLTNITGGSSPLFIESIDYEGNVEQISL